MLYIFIILFKLFFWLVDMPLKQFAKTLNLIGSLLDAFSHVLNAIDRVIKSKDHLKRTWRHHRRRKHK